MPTPSTRVSVMDVEIGLVQPAGNHGITYPTTLAVTGMTAGGSGSQASTAKPTVTTQPNSHHHE